MGGRTNSLVNVEDAIQNGMTPKREDTYEKVELELSKSIKNKCAEQILNSILNLLHLQNSPELNSRSNLLLIP